MKHFFVLLTQDHYTSKNALQKAFKDHCNELDRTLLEGKEERLRFITELERRVIQLNALHPRCKPLAFVNRSGYGNRGRAVHYIGVDDCCLLAIYEARKEANNG